MNAASLLGHELSLKLRAYDGTNDVRSIFKLGRTTCRPRDASDFSSWHRASFRCDAKFGRYRGHSGLEQAIRPADLLIPGLAANAAYMKLKGALRSAFFIAELPRNCRYFSIKVVAARKRIANAAGVNSGIPNSPTWFRA
ncbi:MAG: hypothetical protein QOF31_5588, partial [Mycobacterium sp.]|nr:hypothetical protein [Mycobacterium sp.]